MAGATCVARCNEFVREVDANAQLIASAPSLSARVALLEEALRILSAEDSQCAPDWVQKKEQARTLLTPSSK